MEASALLAIYIFYVRVNFTPGCTLLLFSVSKSLYRKRSFSVPWCLQLPWSHQWHSFGGSSTPKLAWLYWRGHCPLAMAKGSRLACAVKVLQEQLVSMGVRTKRLWIYRNTPVLQNSSRFPEENGIALCSNTSKHRKTIFKSGRRLSWEDF